MSESLVLLHGFASTSRIWDEVIAALPPERYSPLALDLPGHGSQADAPAPITFDLCVARVLACAPERFVLAGYSMGGRVALHVALAAPERVRRLVLVSTTAGIEDERERARRRARDRALADEIERGPIERFVDVWRSQPMFAHDPPELDTRARAHMAHNRPHGVAAALRGIGTGEMAPLWRRLPELTMPVTIAVGERDAKFLVIAERMARELPRSRLVVMSAGHVLPLERPRAVAESVCAEQSGPGRL